MSGWPGKLSQKNADYFSDENCCRLLLSNISVRINIQMLVAHLFLFVFIHIIVVQVAEVAWPALFFPQNIEGLSFNFILFSIYFGLSSIY